MAELRSIIVFHGRHFSVILEFGIWNLCKTLTGYVRCYSEQYSKKNYISISNRFPGVHKRGIHTDTHRHTHTHTHDHNTRRNAMRCISPKKEKTQLPTDGYGNERCGRDMLVGGTGRDLMRRGYIRCEWLIIWTACKCRRCELEIGCWFAAGIFLKASDRKTARLWDAAEAQIHGRR